MTESEVIAMATKEDSPERILTSIPAEKLQRIPTQICDLLVNNGLSFQQAEMLLAVAKSRLRRVKI